MRVVPVSLVAAISLAACHTMQSIRPAELTGVGNDRVWVTRGDRSIIEVVNPKVQGDTLEGIVFGEFERMPVTEAVTIRARRAAPARTAALIIGASAITLAGIVYMGNRSDVSQSAQTCTTGLPDDNPIACPHN
jgi:hypothetical protein